MTRMSRTMMATTNKMWMKPPMVELATSPSSHRTIRMIAMVVSIRLYRYLVGVGSSTSTLAGSASRVFEMFTGFFDILPEAPNGAAACAKQGEECGSENEDENAFR